MAGQSGQVFAHDPDRRGTLLWKAVLVEKIGESEIFVGSGYVGLGNGTPGNVLLVFGLP